VIVEHIPNKKTPTALSRQRRKGTTTSTGKVCDLPNDEILSPRCVLRSRFPMLTDDIVYSRGGSLTRVKVVEWTNLWIFTEFYVTVQSSRHCVISSLCCAVILVWLFNLFSLISTCTAHVSRSHCPLFFDVTISKSFNVIQCCFGYSVRHVTSAAGIVWYDTCRQMSCAEEYSRTWCSWGGNTFVDASGWGIFAGTNRVRFTVRGRPQYPNACRVQQLWCVVWDFNFRGVLLPPALGSRLPRLRIF